MIFSPNFFPEGGKLFSLFCPFSSKLTPLTRNHPTYGHSFLILSYNPVWFWWNTLLLMGQPGSRDWARYFYLSCLPLWEWVANWINVCQPARVFNWGLLLRIGNQSGRGKTGQNLSVQKCLQIVSGVTHNRNSQAKRLSCVPAESAMGGYPNRVASQQSVPKCKATFSISVAALQQELAKWK